MRDILALRTRLRHRRGSRPAIVCALAVLLGLSALIAAPVVAEPAVSAQGLASASISRSLVHRAAVFGPDNRVVLPGEKSAFSRSVGLLYDSRSHSVCTAFCVGDDVIATAGHCLFRTADERPPKLSGFQFRLQPRNGPHANARLAGSGRNAEAQHVATGSQRLRVRPPIDAASDWALVRLAAPVCKGRALPISRQPDDELIRLSAAQRVYQVAYHRDFGNWELALGAPCAIRRSFNGADWPAISKDFVDARHVILHTCDTGGASSGSPMLIDGPAGPEVVGINVGTYLQSRVLTQQGAVVHRYKSETVANTAVAAGAFRDALEALSRATILADRKAITALQTLLAAAGYDAGPRDGIYGARLNTAIRSFERAEGRKETGLATAELLRRLAALDAERRGTTPGVARPPHVETGSIGSHTLSDGKANLKR
jgi:V8-like Glu-specific endopeptidase